MKKMKQQIEYAYYVHPAGENGDEAYEAIIPAFNNAVVFGDTLEELGEGIQFAIESEIAERKKKKLPVPKPDKTAHCNGKILLRISPHLHEQLVLEASANRKSLNTYIEAKLTK